MVSHLDTQSITYRWLTALLYLTENAVGPVHPDASKQLVYPNSWHTFPTLQNENTHSSVRSEIRHFLILIAADCRPLTICRVQLTLCLLDLNWARYQILGLMPLSLFMLLLLLSSSTASQTVHVVITVVLSSSAVIISCHSFSYIMLMSIFLHLSPPWIGYPFFNASSLISGFDEGGTTVDDIFSRDPSKLWENLGPAANFAAKDVRNCSKCRESEKKNVENPWKIMD